jgi:hypothetical protein
MNKISILFSLVLISVISGCHIGSSGKSTTDSNSDIYRWPSIGPVSEQYLKNHCKADPKLTLVKIDTYNGQLTPSSNNSHETFQTTGTRDTCVSQDTTGLKLCADNNAIEVPINIKMNAISANDMQQNYHPNSKVIICGEAYQKAGSNTFGLHFVHQKIINQQLTQYGYVAIENVNEHKFYMIAA